jgi:ketosteroid isomerase-like protein
MTDLINGIDDETSPGTRVGALFSALDNRDMDTFIGFLADDVVVHFGNSEPIQGTHEFVGLFASVMSALKAVKHDVNDVWQDAAEPTVLIARLTVHYTRADDLVVSLPVCNVFRLRDDGRIFEYRVYVDMAPVFEIRSPN